MLSFFSQWQAYRKFKKDVDDGLAILFGGWGSNLMVGAKQLVPGWPRTVRVGFDEGMPARECSVLVATFIIGTAIDQMKVPDKLAAFEAMKGNDTKNVFNRNFNYMMSYAEEFTTNDFLLNGLLAEVTGKLRGLSRDEIDQERRDAGLRQILKQP